MLSCEYCGIVKNTYFEEHMQTAAFEANVVNEFCSEKLHKSIWKALAIEFFLSKVADLQPENLKPKRYSAIRKIFRTVYL